MQKHYDDIRIYNRKKEDIKDESVLTKKDLTVFQAPELSDSSFIGNIIKTDNPAILLVNFTGVASNSGAALIPNNHIKFDIDDEITFFMQKVLDTNNSIPNITTFGNGSDSSTAATQAQLRTELNNFIASIRTRTGLTTTILPDINTNAYNASTNPLGFSGSATISSMTTTSPYHLTIIYNLIDLLNLELNITIPKPTWTSTSYSRSTFITWFNNNLIAAINTATSNFKSINYVFSAWNIQAPPNEPATIPISIRYTAYKGSVSGTSSPSNMFKTGRHSAVPTYVSITTPANRDNYCIVSTGTGITDNNIGNANPLLESDLIRGTTIILDITKDYLATLGIPLRYEVTIQFTDSLTNNVLIHIRKLS